MRHARRWCSPAAIRPTPTVAARPAPRDLVIAADSGLDHAHALGLPGRRRRRRLRLRRTADALDGRSRRGQRRSSGTRRRRTQPTSSWRSVAARAAGAERVVVVGGDGGRLDHFLAERAPARVADVRRTAASRRASATRASTSCAITSSSSATPGDLVHAAPRRRPRPTASSPRACGSRCARRRLRPGSTRGVSNELLAPHAPRRADRRGVLARRSSRLVGTAVLMPTRYRPHSSRGRSLALLALRSSCARIADAASPRPAPTADDHARGARLVRGLEVGAARRSRSRPASR